MNTQSFLQRFPLAQSALKDYEAKEKQNSQALQAEFEQIQLELAQEEKRKFEAMTTEEIVAYWDNWAVETGYNL